ncbi:MAG: site-specific integrase [Paracoccaceae bacterium]
MFWRKKNDSITVAITMNEFFYDQYLPNAIVTKKRGRDDRLTYAKHIAGDFGNIPISEISSRKVNDWRNKQVEKRLKNSTINKHIDFLMNIIKLAYVWGFLEEQLHVKIDVRKLPVGNYTQKFLSQTEIRRLLSGCMVSPHPYLYFVVKLLLLTGARVGELRNARWSDIDEQKSIWHVPVSKNGRSREIFLSSEALSTFHKVRRKSEFLGPIDPRNGYVFTNPRTRTKYDSFYAAWYKVVRSEGLSDVRIHDLRHTYASLLINNEVSIYEVQRLLGHSNITMTQRYAHLLRDKLHERTEVVSKSISNSWI